MLAVCKKVGERQRGDDEPGQNKANVRTIFWSSDARTFPKESPIDTLFALVISLLSLLKWVASLVSSRKRIFGRASKLSVLLYPGKT